MTIVDALLASPGTYLGLNRGPDGGAPGAARLVVTALPGGAGVTLDYEVLNPNVPDRLRPHHEHAVVAKANDGTVVMVTAHTHASTVAILHETTAGTFELGAEGSPFPMRIVISVPAPGNIRHAWWYGAPGGDVAERDVADLTRID